MVQSSIIARLEEKIWNAYNAESPSRIHEAFQEAREEIEKSGCDLLVCPHCDRVKKELIGRMG